MLVYRVENFDGIGAYRTGVPFTFLASDWHPNPWNDVHLKQWWGLESRRQYYFGFKSLQQFSEWFRPDEWHIFDAFNKGRAEEGDRVGVSVYDCPDDLVKAGDKQVVFVKDSSQRLRIIDFRQLMDGYWEVEGVSPTKHDKYVIPA